MNEKDNQIIHYRQIYMQYAPILLKFANRFVSSFFVEDIVHDVFLKIWDKQVFLLPEEEVKRILFAAVRNACIDHLRRMSLEEEIIDKRALQLKIDELNFFESSEDFFMRQNILEFVLKKIEELPERKQEIFRLSYIEGMKANEIAKQLNLSVRTVENQLYRTLLLLRKSLSSKFIFLFILF